MSSSTNPLDRIRIEKLKGPDGWTAWKVLMEDYLWNAKVWGYVAGTTKKPTAKAEAKAGDKAEAQVDTKEIDEWEEKDRLALSLIRACVSPSILDLVLGCKTSADAWKALSANFEKKGLMELISVRRKLLQAQYSDGDDLEEWLREMSKLRTRLSTLGNPMPDKEFSITLITGLPGSWDSFVGGLNLRSDLDDADELMSRIREMGGHLANAEVAMAARMHKPGNKPKCWKCGKPGYQRDCPNHDKKPSGKGGKGGDKGKGKPGTPKALVTETADRDSDDDGDSCHFTYASTDEPDAVALSIVDADTWLADTGTTVHVARERANFSSYVATPGRTLRGAGLTPILGRGTVDVIFECNGRSTTVTLRDVVHAPGVPHNLISVGRVEAGGHKVEMDNGRMRFIDPKGRAYATGQRVSNYLYAIEVTPIGSGSSDDVVCAAAPARPIRKKTWDEWHRIFGHISMKSIMALKKRNMVVGMAVDESKPPSEQCETCVQAKQTIAPFPKKSDTEIAEIGDLTVMDLWGPASVRGIRGERYFATFTDVKARRTETAFCKHKSEALTLFKSYKARMETSRGIKLKRVRFDNGGEYVNDDFGDYLREEGIAIDTTAPRSSTQNGIAERLNRTLMDHAMAAVIAAGLPKFLWPDAVEHITYLKNRSPTRALEGITPVEAWTGKKPDVADLQEWGAKCWVLTPRTMRTKLDPKSRSMHFVGMAAGSKAWKYYDPKSRRVGKSRNLIFAITKRTSGSVPELTEGEYDFVDLPAPALLEGESSIEGEQPSGGDRALDRPQAPPAPIIPDADVPEAAPRRALRTVPRIDYKAYGDTGARITKETPTVSDEDAHEEAHCMCLLTLHGTETVHEPRTLSEAQAAPEWPEWKRAMDDEIAQLRKLGTYAPADLPAGRKPIGCRWVYRLKRDSDGRIVRYKARLVAQGFSQAPGLDYFETFAPVIRTDSLRLLLAIAAERNMELAQFDVVGAYLNADLDEEIYMRQPPGYEEGSSPIVRLRKALYGLKQAGRQWNLVLPRGEVTLKQCAPCLDRLLGGGVQGRSEVALRSHQGPSRLLDPKRDRAARSFRPDRCFSAPIPCEYRSRYATRRGVCAIASRVSLPPATHLRRSLPHLSLIFAAELRRNVICDRLTGVID